MFDLLNRNLPVQFFPSLTVISPKRAAEAKGGRAVSWP
jgi:hypothetical protein